MNEQEARLLFGLEAGFEADELQDALEMQLFELKRFFTSRAPVEKLFRSRLEKLKKFSEALDVLDPAYEPGFDENFPEVDFASDDILVVFQHYQQQNRSLKTALSQSTDPAEIYRLTEALLSLEKQYAGLWAVEGVTDKDALVSKESDPMEILEAVKAFREKGGTSFDALKKSQNQAPEALVNEMKRLSLLFFKY